MIKSKTIICTNNLIARKNGREIAFQRLPMEGLMDEFRDVKYS